MTDAARLAIHPSVVFRELDGEAVLLNLDSGVYYGLDAVGTRVWALVVEHGTARGVCDQMEKEYAVSPEVLERDVDRLITEMRDKGLLVTVAPA
ncbi:MAG TPA: PqqD family protein [Vicinamibacterales bacterium]